MSHLWLTPWLLVCPVTPLPHKHDGLQKSWYVDKQSQHSTIQAHLAVYLFYPLLHKSKSKHTECILCEMWEGIFVSLCWETFGGCGEFTLSLGWNWSSMKLLQTELQISYGVMDVCYCTMFAFWRASSALSAMVIVFFAMKCCAVLCLKFRQKTKLVLISIFHLFLSFVRILTLADE